MRLFLGQRAWMLQRATAVVLLIFLAAAAAMLLAGPRLSYERWHALATSPHGAVLIVVLFAALALHGWIGIRDIVLDYIHPPAGRLLLLGLIALVLIAIVIRVALTMAAHFTTAG